MKKIIEIRKAHKPAFEAACGTLGIAKEMIRESDTTNRETLIYFVTGSPQSYFKLGFQMNNFCREFNIPCNISFIPD